MLDKLATTMMSFVTTYFESCGDSLETLLTEDHDRRSRSSSIKKQQMTQETAVRQQLDSQEDTGLCFHCGSFPDLVSLSAPESGVGVDDHTRRRPIELRKFEDSDLEFFPIPKSEVVDPRFRGLSDRSPTSRCRRPTISPTSSFGSVVDDKGPRAHTSSEHQQQKFQPAKWTAPRYLTGSPSPEVSSKWIAMKRSEKTIGVTRDSLRGKKDEIQPFPFDEIPSVPPQSTSIASYRALRQCQRPPVAPGRPPLAKTTNIADESRLFELNGSSSIPMITIHDASWDYFSTSAMVAEDGRRSVLSHKLDPQRESHSLTSAAATTDSKFFQQLKLAPKTRFTDSSDENQYSRSNNNSNNTNRYLYRFDRAPRFPDIVCSLDKNPALTSTSSTNNMGKEKEKSKTKSSRSSTSSNSSSSKKSHWKSAVDPRTGRTYFYHEITRETQWRKPMELATDEEKRAMEEKERKQKDFFSAMEANILNSINQGVMPGTPVVGGGDAGAVGQALGRRMSSRKVSLGPDGRPELVRTISTMDENVLMDVIRRQPSFRNFLPGSREDSLQPADLLNSRRRPSEVRDGFENWSEGSHSQNQPLETLEERFNESTDSMPALLNFLPDGIDDNDGDENGSLRQDGGDLNESSLTGFGLTWEETQALKKLASITKEMIDAEKDVLVFEESPQVTTAKLASASGATPSWKPKDDKEKRDLPRELDFNDSDEDESESNSNNQLPSLNKAREGSDGRALPREIDLDFDSSDEESERPPTPKDSNSGHRLKKTEKTEKDDARPEIKRRNTCGTMYIGTTMSAPDKDATIRCVCGVLRSHILSSEHDTRYNPETGKYKVFNDQESEQGGQSFEFSNNMRTAKPPSLDEVATFYRDIFFKAQMEADCIIMSLIYVERLIKKTAGRLRPRAGNWRSLLFSCMILSSKVWDDLSMWNVDFSQSCPPGVSFSLKRINELELAVLNALSFKVKVPASEYAKYYFLLRSMLIKSGLAGDDLSALNPLDVQGARKLQQVSSQFESLSLTKGDPLGPNQRSKSLVQKAAALAYSSKPKLGLEQVVKM